MKTKAILILKSLADLPANALAFATYAPGRTMNASKAMLGAGVRATRREIRAARQHSAEMFRDIYRRANTPFRHITPWSRGGLNE